MKKIDADKLFDDVDYLMDCIIESEGADAACDRLKQDIRALIASAPDKLQGLRAALEKIEHDGCNDDAHIARQALEDAEAEAFRRYLPDAVAVAEKERDEALGLWEGAQDDLKRAREDNRDLRNKVAEYALTIDNLMQEKHDSPLDTPDEPQEYPV